jgi:voltage-gated potassium channel Kch
MTLTEKYIREIQKYLPGKIKREVAEEILDGIRQGMAEGEKEADVIEGFGDPRKVALGYAPQIDYLIGPQLRFLYKRILGIVLVAVGIGLTVARVVSLLVTPESLFTFFLKLLGSYYNAGIMIFGTVTLIFFLINRQMDEEETLSEEKSWRVEDLKKTPEPSEEINLTGSLLGVLSSFAGVILLVFYLKPVDAFVINLALVMTCRWLLLALLLPLLGVEVILVIRRRNSNLLRVLRLLSGMALSGAVIFLITREDFLNPRVIEGFQGSLAVVGTLLKNIPLVTVAIILMVTGFEIHATVKALSASKERWKP